MSRFGAWCFGLLFVFTLGVLTGMTWNGDDSGDDPAPVSNVEKHEQPRNGQPARPQK